MNDYTAHCCPDCEKFRFTKDEMSKLAEALEEAAYLLNATDKDMQKKAGLYRIVTALEKLKEKNA